MCLTSGSAAVVVIVLWARRFSPYSCWPGTADMLLSHAQHLGLEFSLRLGTLEISSGCSAVGFLLLEM